MTILTDRSRNGAAILSEANGLYSRESVTIAQNAAFYEAGTVLKLESGEYSRAAAADTAVAVLVNGVNAVAADAPGVILARSAEVKRDELVFAADVDTDAERLVKFGQLAAAGIIVR